MPNSKNTFYISVKLRENFDDGVSSIWFDFCILTTNFSTSKLMAILRLQEWESTLHKNIPRIKNLSIQKLCNLIKLINLLEKLVYFNSHTPALLLFSTFYVFLFFLFWKYELFWKLINYNKLVIYESINIFPPKN